MTILFSQEGGLGVIGFGARADLIAVDGDRSPTSQCSTGRASTSRIMKDAVSCKR